MSKELSAKFINSVIFMCRLFPAIKDPFYNKKLYLKLSSFFGNYMEQQKDIGNTIHSVDELDDLLDFMGHAGFNPILLASARRGLLKFKLALIKERAGSAVPAGLAAKKEPTVPENSKQPDPIRVKKTVNDRNKKLNSSQEKILSYIRESAQARAKQVIDQFNDLSERTVKRNLTELHRIGLLTKYAENRAVYYKLNS